MCLDPVTAVQEPLHEVLLEIGLACLQSFAGDLNLWWHWTFEMHDQPRLEIIRVKLLPAYRPHQNNAITRARHGDVETLLIASNAV